MRLNIERGLKRAAVLFGIITAIISFLWMRSILIDPDFKGQISYELIRGLYIFSFGTGFLSGFGLIVMIIWIIKRFSKENIEN